MNEPVTLHEWHCNFCHLEPILTAANHLGIGHCPRCVFDHKLKPEQIIRSITHPDFRWSTRAGKYGGYVLVIEGRELLITSLKKLPSLQSDLQQVPAA
jgi:hypothetical protein